MLIHDYNFWHQARRYSMRLILNKKESGLRLLISTIGIILLSSSCTLSDVSPGTKNIAGFLATDFAGCKQKADTLISRELKLDRSYDRSGSNSLEISFARFDAHKQRERYFHNCISERKSQRVRDIKK